MSPAKCPASNSIVPASNRSGLYEIVQVSKSPAGSMANPRSTFDDTASCCIGTNATSRIRTLAAASSWTSNVTWNSGA